MLQQITTVIKSFATSHTEVFSDLEGHQVIGGTIPADVLVTRGQGSKPDLVIINRTEKKIAHISVLLTKHTIRNSQTIRLELSAQ